MENDVSDANENQTGKEKEKNEMQVAMSNCY